MQDLPHHLFLSTVKQAHREIVLNEVVIDWFLSRRGLPPTLLLQAYAHTGAGERNASNFTN